MMPAWTQPRLTSISWQISPCRVLAACPRTGLSLVGAGHVSRSRAVIGGEPAGVAACVGGLLSARPEPERSEAQRAVRSVGAQTSQQSVTVPGPAAISYSAETLKETLTERQRRD